MLAMDILLATQGIKAISKGQKITIGALTAKVMSGDRGKYLAAGITGYKAKPIDHRALANVLDKILAIEIFKP